MRPDLLRRTGYYGGGYRGRGCRWHGGGGHDGVAAITVAEVIIGVKSRAVTI
jgi:hypothetical protein